MYLPEPSEVASPLHGLCNPAFAQATRYPLAQRPMPPLVIILGIGMSLDDTGSWYSISLGKNFIHTPIKQTCTKASIPFRACFLWSLLLAITVSVRVPARNSWCSQEEHWRDFSKCSVYQERAERSEKAKHEGLLVSWSCHYSWPGREGVSRGQGKRLPQQTVKSQPTTGLWEGPGDRSP